MNSLIACKCEKMRISSNFCLLPGLCDTRKTTRKCVFYFTCIHIRAAQTFRRLLIAFGDHFFAMG